jgi:5S rRNA maturation endonuclease (ribonuclease M5)
MTRPLLYVIRGPDAEPVAIHERQDGPAGKRFRWWTLGPDGEPTPSLQGRPVTDLPLYGAQHAAKWDQARPVYVVEGEKAAYALAQAGYRAVGHVAGAGVMPSDESLAILIALHLILWPDADRPGTRLMQAIAKRMTLGAASVQWATWADAPEHGDAADFLAGGLALEDLQLGPVPPVEATPAELIEFAEREARRRKPQARRRWGQAPPSRAPSATESLFSEYGIASRSGRSVRCPFHDDRHPSLSILPDDRRVICHAAGCWAHNGGHGRSAWELAHGPGVAS